MTDAFLSLNGSRAMTGRLTIPLYGAWTSDFLLASSAPITADNTLVIGDLSLKGTAQRMASFSGARSVLSVGGKGGWRKPLPARGYTHEAGVMLSTILGDAAKECGETIVVDADVSVGPGFARRSTIAERVLRRLVGGRWWIDPDGVTRTAPRDASPITSPFTVEHWSGSKGRFAVATETYADWMPGRTFSSPTVTTPQTVSSVTYTADNDGKLRLDVLTDATAEDRLHDRIRAVIRDEVSAHAYAGTFEYIVAASAGLGLSSTIDATPTDPNMPALLRVPLAPELGLVCPPLTGTRCRIRFANGDPTRFECVALGATTEHATTIEAVALLIYNVLCELALAQPGAFTGLVVQPLVAAAVVAAIQLQGTPAPVGLVAQAAEALAEAGNFASGTPARTSAPFSAAIAGLLPKSLNVSGLFPGIGVPSNG